MNPQPDPEAVEPEPGPSTSPDALAGEGLEHLRRAALEMVAATRAMLDAAEEVVADPRHFAGLVQVLGSAGEAVNRLARQAGAPSSGRERPGDGADDPEDDGPIERIPIS